MGNLNLVPGSLFAHRFEIELAAGSGGMGTVYRARDRYSGEVVALKLLHSERSGAAEVDRFAREAQLLAEQHHPGIVAHVAHGQTPDGQCFLAMEWLEGEDLGQRLLRGPLPLRDCLLILRQVAAALALAHERAVIHRDRRHKHKICLQRGHRALHERRTDYAFGPFAHSPLRTYHASRTEPRA